MAVGDQIDIILFGDDLGSQRGPLISPAMYREFFKPRHGALWKRAHELSGAKVMLHCCGGVRELLPDLIEAGLDAINPVQISCRGMDPAGLKRDFGRELVFWGVAATRRRSCGGGRPRRRASTCGVCGRPGRPVEDMCSNKCTMCWLMFPRRTLSRCWRRFVVVDHCLIQRAINRP